MLTIDTTGNISWGQPDWERIYNSPNNTKSVDELIKECRDELTEMHLTDLKEKVNISERSNLPICERYCQYRGLCCDKDNPDIRGCVGTLRDIVYENKNYNPATFRKKISNTRLKKLIKEGKSLEYCEERTLTNGESCIWHIAYGDGCGACRYLLGEIARQNKEFRSTLKRQNITLEMVSQFKKVHKETVDTDIWSCSDCIDYCPLYGVFCDYNNPDKTSCVERGFEIALENERKTDKK